MTATATHDTKRGEDARARLIALTEIAGEWAALVARWKVMNARHLDIAGEMRSPSVTAEYMLYQALLGAWPLEQGDTTLPDRFQAYALKAAREGKEETSWLNPNQAYEAGLKTFIDRILDPSLSGEFLDSLNALAQRLALLGALNSLSQLTLKATMPGVPDFYQGTELWDLSLVDPDNRRPVDFDVRERLLASGGNQDWRRLAQSWRSGELKFAWTRHLLTLRSELADVFTRGDHIPLDVSGPHRDHVVAFARRRGRDAAIIAVVKSFAPLTDSGRVWPRMENLHGTVNLEGFLLDGMRGRTAGVALSSLLGDLPVAALKARRVVTARSAQRIRA